jgi:hypothetical protein
MGNQSGRADLNRRPLGPEPSALAELSHAPKILQVTKRRDYNLAIWLWQGFSINAGQENKKHENQEKIHEGIQ